MTREEQRTELLIYRIKDNCFEVAKKLLEDHDKQIRAETLKEYMLKDCDSCEAHLREEIRVEVLTKFAKRLLDYDTQLTKEDIIDELCFFIDRDDVEKWLKEQK